MNADLPTSRPGGEENLPFVAPCRELQPAATLRWVALGWRDILRAPGASVAYGLLVGAISWLVSLLAFTCHRSL